VPFDGTSTDTYAADLRAAISELHEECDGVVVFCDLLGGTPFNQAMLASQVFNNVEVVAGVNLPMLIELIVMRGAYATAEDTAEAAVTVGQAGVTHKKLEPMGDDEDDEM
ncbi:PTS sugar transporter subunit IIA, partial [Enorma sp.]